MRRCKLCDDELDAEDDKLCEACLYEEDVAKEELSFDHPSRRTPADDEPGSIWDFNDDEPDMDGNEEAVY